MTDLPQGGYIAVVSMRFGRQDLNPGDPVPHEVGRDYRTLLRLGKIALAPASASKPDGALVSIILPGERAVFLGADGNLEEVTFLELREAPAHAQEHLSLQPGERVALVDFGEGSDEPTLVRLDQVLSSGLAMHVQAALETCRHAEQELTHLVEQAQAQASVSSALASFLERHLKAVRAVGNTELPAKFPGRDALAAAGITTFEALTILTSGEQPGEDLQRLDGIGAGFSRQIMEQLSRQVSDQTPATEGGAPPTAES